MTKIATAAAIAEPRRFTAWRSDTSPAWTPNMKGRVLRSRMAGFVRIGAPYHPFVPFYQAHLLPIARPLIATWAGVSLALESLFCARRDANDRPVLDSLDHVPSSVPAFGAARRGGCWFVTRRNEGLRLSQRHAAQNEGEERHNEKFRHQVDSLFDQAQGVVALPKFYHAERFEAGRGQTDTSW